MSTRKQIQARRENWCILQLRGMTANLYRMHNDLSQVKTNGLLTTSEDNIYHIIAAIQKHQENRRRNQNETT